MHQLVGDENIVMDHTTKDECAMILANSPVKKIFQMISPNLHDNFVNNSP